MGSFGFQHSRQIGVFLSGDEGVFLQVFHQHAESLFLSVLGRRRLETVCGGLRVPVSIFALFCIPL